MMLKFLNVTLNEAFQLIPLNIPKIELNRIEILKTSLCEAPCIPLEARKCSGITLGHHQVCPAEGLIHVAVERNMGWRLGPSE